MRETKLWISLPDGIHNNNGLKISSNDKELVQRFRKLGWKLLMTNQWSAGTPMGDTVEEDNIKRKLHTFLQSDHDEFVYFECWGAHVSEAQDILLERAMQIADELGLELEIERM